MKIFDPKVQTYSFLNKLVSAKLFDYSRKMCLAPKRILCVNIPDSIKSSFRQLYKLAQIENIQLGHLNQFRLPASVQQSDLVIANLALIYEHIDLAQLFKDINHILSEENHFIFATWDHSDKDFLIQPNDMINREILDEQRVLAELDPKDIQKISSFKEHLYQLNYSNEAIECHIFVVSKKDSLQPVMAPGFIVQTDQGLEAKLEAETVSLPQEEKAFELNDSDLPQDSEQELIALSEAIIELNSASEANLEPVEEYSEDSSFASSIEEMSVVVQDEPVEASTEALLVAANTLFQDSSPEVSEHVIDAVPSETSSDSASSDIDMTLEEVSVSEESLSTADEETIHIDQILEPIEKEVHPDKDIHNVVSNDEVHTEIDQSQEAYSDPAADEVIVAITDVEIEVELQTSVSDQFSEEKEEPQITEGNDSASDDEIFPEAHADKQFNNDSSQEEVKSEELAVSDIVEEESEQLSISDSDEEGQSQEVASYKDDELAVADPEIEDFENEWIDSDFEVEIVIKDEVVESDDKRNSDIDSEADLGHEADSQVNSDDGEMEIDDSYDSEIQAESGDSSRENISEVDDETVSSIENELAVESNCDDDSVSDSESGNIDESEDEVEEQSTIDTEEKGEKFGDFSEIDNNRDSEIQTESDDSSQENISEVDHEAASSIQNEFVVENNGDDDSDSDNESDNADELEDEIEEQSTKDAEENEEKFEDVEEEDESNKFQNFRP